MSAKREDLLGETLYELAKRARSLGVPGYARMSKEQLIEAIDRYRDRDNEARRELGEPG